MKDKELKWVDMMGMILDASPDLETTTIPKNKLRKLFHSLAISRKFDVFIMICIVLNMG